MDKVDEIALKSRKHGEEWGGLIGALFVFAAVLVLGYQCFVFLRSGEWPSYTLLTVLAHFGYQWSYWPQSWFGLHAILGFIPLGWLIVGAGLVPLLLATAS
jgi:hypothetical protein